MKTITVTDQSYAYQRIDVRRKCGMTDLQAKYIVTFEIDSSGDEIAGSEHYDFDEYYCNNCGNYDIDFGEDHQRP